MAIDSRAFRQTVGQFATGVTVIALEVDATIRAMTANSFTSLSLDPPLVLFCVGMQTKVGQAVHDATGFSINVLAEGQQDISTYFAGGWKQGPPPAFSFIDAEGGARLEGCVASLGCRIHAVYEGGDHWIVVGRVVTLYRAESAPRPLVFFRGAYVGLEEARTLVAPTPALEGIAW